MKDSLLISFEGVDGCGKTTQIGLLKKYFEDHEKRVAITEEPRRTGLGKVIRGAILEGAGVSSMTAMMLFAADRRDDTEQNILPALQQGSMVICDRFIDSSVVYQGIVGGIDMKIIEQLNWVACTGRVPDMTILIDIDPVVSLRRKETFDNFEKQGVLELARNGYLQVAEKNKKRFFVVAGNQSKEEIHKAIITELERRFNS